MKVNKDSIFERVKPVECREGAEVVVHGWEGNDFN